MMLRFIIAWPIGWSLYWLGHAVSRPMEWWDLGFLYPAYNRLMIWSYLLSDWGQAGIWQDSVLSYEDISLERNSRNSSISL